MAALVNKTKSVSRSASGENEMRMRGCAQAKASGTLRLQVDEAAGYDAAT
ncbi:hypothetical protein ACFQZS_15700 [Mucilaginibacter calamicampi]|uniref:Uncharacterized protein n=1 Tax=Mucilaginibacter calamicampi TaxID=1302352 RepID=A0ABW2YYL8_9SPHI